MMKIIFGGPPHSGKSCLRVGLKSSISRLGSGHYLYVITANPDGEGAWFQEAFANDPERAMQWKADYKAQFSPERVEMWARAVAECRQPLVGIDIGGRITEENRQICAHGTHAILIAGDTEEASWQTRLEPWRQFCDDLRLTVIAEIYSDYFSKTDELLPSDSGVFRGSVHRLDRKVHPKKLGIRPTIAALAKHLADLT